MKKIVVIYKSVYGSTQKYADWIAERLDADIYQLKDIDKNVLNHYRIIIFGAPVFCRRCFNVRMIKRLLKEDPERHLFVFAVALGILVYDTDYRQMLRDRIPEAMLARLKIYTFPGAIDYDRLTFKHRIVLNLMHKELRRIVPSKRGEEAKLFFETYGKTSDFTDKLAIETLVRDCLEQKKP